MTLLKTAKRRSMAATVALCVGFAVVLAVARAQAEVGLIDDWSYVRSAQLLAQTGHIHYNGWATSMLGWQLYAGALLMKVFGGTFLAARLAVMACAVVTIALVHRCLLRLGLSLGSASFVTAASMFTGAFLVLSGSFMSDIPGMLAIYVCLYCCLRSLDATPGRQVVWLCAAIVLNALLGTARQIAWLGLLVLVPAFLWRLRHVKRRFLLLCSAAWAAAVAFVFGCLLWFAHQPYALREPTFFFHRGQLYQLPFVFLAGCELIAPVLLLLLSSMPLAGSVLSVVAAFLLTLATWHFGPASAISAAVDITQIHFLTSTVPRLLTFFALLGVSAVFVRALRGIRHQNGDNASTGSTAIRSAALLIPFLLAYFFLVVTRAVIFPRYLVPVAPLFCAVVLLAVPFRVQRPVLFAGCLLLCLNGALGVIGVHDVFSMLRALGKAEKAYVASGGKRDQLRATFPLDMLYQVDATGYVNDYRMHLPAGAYRKNVPRIPQCASDWDAWTPSIDPRFALSTAYNACTLYAGFPAVSYSAWWPPTHREIVTGVIPREH